MTAAEKNGTHANRMQVAYREQIYTLVVNSRERDRAKFPNAASFEVELPFDLTDVVRAGVITWNIPLTMRPVDHHNNKFELSYNGGAVQTVAVTPSMYDGSRDLSAAVASALTAAGGGAASVTCLSDDDYLLFESGLPFTLRFPEGTPLGFLPNVDYPSQSTDGGITHRVRAPAWPNLEGYDLVMLECKELGVGHYMNSRAFAHLDLRYVPTGADSDVLVHRLNSPVLRANKLTIRLMRDSHNLYDLKGREVTLVFRFVRLEETRP